MILSMKSITLLGSLIFLVLMMACARFAGDEAGLSQPATESVVSVLVSRSASESNSRRAASVTSSSGDEAPSRKLKELRA